MSNLATIVNNILADSGIDDINVVVTNGSYSNPAWITALSWSKITGTPTTLAGYGITNGVPTSRTLTINGVSYDLSADRTWTIASGVTSVNAGTGISVNQTTGAVTVTNTGVLSINGSTGAVTGILTTSNYNSYAPTLTGGGASGTWGINITGSANTLDGYDYTQFTGVLARYGTTAGASSRIRITAPFNTNSSKMFSVDITMYAGYSQYKYTVSAYMYGSINQWYDPKAIFTGTGTAPDIYVGRDANGKAYISIANGNYTGIVVNNFVGGYVSSEADAYIPWTITLDSGSENSVSVSVFNTLNSSNYNSYAPTLTGGGASGTWGISITGTAAGETLATVTGRGATTTSPITINGGGSQPLTLITSSSGPWAINLYRSDIASNTRVFNNGGYWYFEHRPQFNGNWALDAGNYNSYAPTLTGGGASGTWGISITGNAGYASTAGDAGSLDGLDSTDFMRNYGMLNNTDVYVNFRVMRNSNTSAVNDGMYIGYANSNSGITRIFGGGATTGELIKYSNYTYEPGSFRAPYFYDSDNTAYYIKASGTSYLYNVGSFYLKNNYAVSTDHQYGIYFASDMDTAYAIYRESGAWTSPFPDLRISFHTGIKIGANAGYNGVRFYNDYTMATQVMSVNNGSDGLGANNVYVNNSLVAGSSLRAPYFYDSDNTGYYGKFSGTSNLNQITVNYIGVGQGVNTGYRIITSGDYYANAGGNYWAEGRFKQYRGSGSWWNVIDEGNYSSFAVPISGGINMTGSYGLNDSRLYLRTNGDTNHYLWNASDDWEELGAYAGTGFRVTSNNGSNGLLYVYGSSNGGYTYSPYSFRSPYFYDSDDTNYYVKANGESNLWRFTAAAMTRNAINYLSINSPYTTRPSQGVAYQNGTMGWGQIDFNTIFSNWGSGFIDTWSNPGNAPGGSSHYVGLQGMHYNFQNSSQGYGFQMACAGEADNRFFWRSAWPNLRSWVEMIHSGNIGSQSVSYASSAGNADTLDGYHGSNYLGFNGNSYYQASTWIQFNTTAGLYWPSYNGAHLYANDGSYGSIKILGSRNGWYGIEFGNLMNLMANTNESGFHNNNYGWQFRWNDGTLYCHKNTYGGGTSAAVLDSSNSPYAWNMNQYVRTSDSPTFANVYSTGDVIAYYSDERLKEKKGAIDNPLEKIKQLNGFYYVNNELAKSFGYEDKKVQIGLSAQEVQKIFPEVVTLAPFDTKFDENQNPIGSKSGEHYLTLDYAKLVPLLVEAVKEQQKEIDKLKSKLS